MTDPATQPTPNHDPHRPTPTPPEREGRVVELWQVPGCPHGAAYLGAQLVEVLPTQEYAELHLPRAVNIPLKTLDATTTAGLDRGRPVVVYCWDAL